MKHDNNSDVIAPAKRGGSKKKVRPVLVTATMEIKKRSRATVEDLNADIVGSI